ncbi:alpha-glucosidase [Parastagonospora nodorum]|uniref:alpha-glucosidase n=1 Tax=Phaeosphaeria nodorum (strain SN15 / ATCC MYA-4574 / FGSC 10173) TaxID=321614 RepID=A0A7U2EU34_PHANO|nr:alpha-glucosidase [Parastagonospora nodorum]QRC92013.1 alpha-glucosidase [Parastagonospora nodorum SN15]KAH3931095.1 alpha-glucosidase [Parastagonospora nodorum]KAH3977280.1 alpha-glucosidase [Parastagonospora nodorum]KAH4140587.1 alpha-glucosidase [Parastagonospora nodorum]
MWRCSVLALFAVAADDTRSAACVTPNVANPNAPDAQELFPGYKAVNVVTSDNTIAADLSLGGTACNVYGNEISDLVLEVQYQNVAQVNIKIYPKYIAQSNRFLYILDESLSPSGSISPGCTVNNSDLTFEWTNDPTFQFKVTRAQTGEAIFDTYGQKIVFEDQFLELVTNMVPEYNIYGLPEAIRGSFRLPNQYTQTFWNQYNDMNDQPIDANMHSTHPVFLETHYGNGSSKSHVVYGRNLHGQEWLLRPDRVIYRTIGGSFDFYFFSGPSPTEALAQQQLGVIGTPVMQPYWALGFHQVRWGHQNWTVLQDIIDGYAAANIQLEAIWNDLDYLFQYRIFSHDNNTYPIGEAIEFIARLHANGQYWMPILDPSVYVPAPGNVTDSNPTYDRGKALDLYIKRGEGYADDYIGIQWPGFSVWPDFLHNATQDFWTNEMKLYHDQLPFDGWWLDISDMSSWCTVSCGTGRLSSNPTHVPFKLPGEPGQINYDYPEAFCQMNATEAASASPRACRKRHSLLRQAVAPYATHNDGYNTTEYELHNTYGYVSGKATYAALLSVFLGKRPFWIARSTSPGSGAITGHWGGDTNSRWGNVYMTIPQALTFSVAGIPYFGVEMCDLNGNVDMELCTRWMQLSAFFPLYRNHNSRNTIAQEAFRWATTAEATRRAMDVRFRLLPCQYTLFYAAHKRGETVLRALSWNFPDDESLKSVDNQFMLGPSILIMPVLAPLLRTSQGVFPGVPDTRWYDWYTLKKVQAQPGQNVTLNMAVS